MNKIYKYMLKICILKQGVFIVHTRRNSLTSQHPTSHTFRPIACKTYWVCTAGYSSCHPESVRRLRLDFCAHASFPLHRNGGRTWVTHTSCRTESQLAQRSKQGVGACCTTLYTHIRLAAGPMLVVSTATILPLMPCCAPLHACPQLSAFHTSRT